MRFTAEHPRIQSLRNPLAKMSKSDPAPSAKILLTDSRSEIQAKIKSAVTDSTIGVTWDPKNRPGIATLLQIHSGYSGDSVKDLASLFAGEKGIRELKESCADAVDRALEKFRGEYERVRKEDGYLRERERDGARRAQEVAQGVMKEVRQVVGTA